MLAVLDGGMCEWHVSFVPRDKLRNTQQRRMPEFVPSFMPCIARKYLRIRNATYFYQAWSFIRSLLIFKCAHEIASL